MQGQLRKERLSCRISTSCAHCGQPIELEINSDLHSTVRSAGADPLVFTPMVDFEKLADPSIIDAF